ncbi:MAG: polyprenyl synthetase family protein [Paenibacillus sp.]|nr:polyprenyl synthetase family protein [Paenibacillus sp.]
MNNVTATMEHANAWYAKAESKAGRYLALLQQEVERKSYIAALNADFTIWKKGHIRSQRWQSAMSAASRKPDSRDYGKFLRWQRLTGNLDDYLERSVTYMYMRDLGKDPSEPGTGARIASLVQFIKQNLIPKPDSGAENSGEPDYMSLSGLYRWAQKEGVETAMIWAIQKLRNVAANIPDEMNAEHAVRKLIKIMIGVVLHVMDDMDETVPSTERSRRLDEGIRLGYSYGLTYPFIDDLLDSSVLEDAEKAQYARMIRHTLLHGSVPDVLDWNGKSAALIRYVHGELREAFEWIRTHQSAETLPVFYEQSYVFFESQDIDRGKSLADPSYTNEELLLPIIIKSASSRLIVRSVIGAETDEAFDERTFYYGIYNQLADDFADLYDDMNEGAVTPYTYYWRYHNERRDLLNPYELYWAVISHLIHRVYRSNETARNVILERAVGGLKRFKARVGSETYREFMDVFASEPTSFNLAIDQLILKAEKVDFFDKLLREQMVTVLRRGREQKEYFIATVQSVREQINALLPFPSQGGDPLLGESLTEAANYSLEGSGKRIRPIVAWVMCVEEYGMKPASIVPLIRSLEYMHTASLIFDDLPTQDNASSRRGRPTLHRVHDSATAELTGLFMIQKAIEEQSSLTDFNPKTVLELIHYSSSKAADMCRGQEMDLRTRGQLLSIEQLNTLCYYKTGIAFEASLMMPAILAGAGAKEIETLKTYAYHAGIAFQIKDDLLDAEGNVAVLGKPAGQDASNSSSTFVTLYGRDGAAKQMWEHYCLASEALRGLPRQSVFLTQLLNYLIARQS